jgi:hypothetical protein
MEPVLPQSVQGRVAMIQRALTARVMIRNGPKLIANHVSLIWVAGPASAIWMRIRIQEWPTEIYKIMVFHVLFLSGQHAKSRSSVYGGSCDFNGRNIFNFGLNKADNRVPRSRTQYRSESRSRCRSRPCTRNISGTRSCGQPWQSQCWTSPSCCTRTICPYWISCHGRSCQFRGGFSNPQRPRSDQERIFDILILACVLSSGIILWSITIPTLQKSLRFSNNKWTF